MPEAPKTQEMSYHHHAEKHKEEQGGGIYALFVYLLNCILFHLYLRVFQFTFLKCLYDCYDSNS